MSELQVRGRACVYTHSCQSSEWLSWMVCSLLYNWLEVIIKRKKHVISQAGVCCCQLTSVRSVVRRCRQAEPLWRTGAGPRAAGRCERTRWWLEQEEEKWPSAPFSGLPETAPCCPGEWMAAAGTAATWPTAPGPEPRDDYAGSSFCRE